MMIGGFPELGPAAVVGASHEPESSPACDASPCPKLPVVKVKWTTEEDQFLLHLVQQFGQKNWIKIAAFMCTRNPRQCRERFNNYCNPQLQQGPWSAEEDGLLERKHAELGAKWNKIAKFFVNRSDNALRNRWQLLARRKAKAKDGSAGQVPKRVSLPIVLPILKGVTVNQTRMIDDPFEMEAMGPDSEFLCAFESRFFF
jgi:hypothetical protein